MTERLYFTSSHKIRWYCLKTFEYDEYREDVSYTIHSCLQLADGKVLISGMLETKKGTQNHMIFLYNLEKTIIKPEPSLGMTGLHMVNINSDVFYIRGNQCEKFCLVTNEIRKLENLNYSHIQAGCCRYFDTVLVVSGINCSAIEVYGENQEYWVQMSNLPICLFDFTCVQIGENEILCINKKRTYRVYVESGECICMQNYKMDINVTPVVRGNYVFSLNSQQELVRYSLDDDKWIVLSRSGCCVIQ